MNEVSFEEMPENDNQELTSDIKSLNISLSLIDKMNVHDRIKEKLIDIEVKKYETSQNLIISEMESFLKLNDTKNQLFKDLKVLSSLSEKDIYSNNVFDIYTITERVVRFFLYKGHKIDEMANLDCYERMNDAFSRLNNMYDEIIDAHKKETLLFKTIGTLHNQILRVVTYFNIVINNPELSKELFNMDIKSNQEILSEIKNNIVELKEVV